MPRTLLLPVQEASGVGEARRLASDWARRLGFDTTEAGKVSLVVTEAANNVVKHAQRGQILLRPLTELEGPGLEILALDQGPGMADVSRCLQDGYSTAGSPGTGLGAMLRLSGAFEVFSQLGKGTVIMARLWAKPNLPRASPFEVGAVCLPCPGETECGDFWAVHTQPGRCAVFVADGLGHGPLAARAAETAVQVFEEHAQLTPKEVLHQAHGPLRPLRGASVGMAEILPGEGFIRWGGVGNIAGIVIDSVRARSLVSHNGTLGHEVHRIQEFQYPWDPDNLLIVHSDGLHSRWNVDTYPGLRRRHPSIIAAVLYRDFIRGRDDVTVLVIRQHAHSR